MEVGILSMRYAKAIIEYAQEKGLEDRLYQEFLTLSHSCLLYTSDAADE